MNTGFEALKAILGAEKNFVHQKLGNVQYSNSYIDIYSRSEYMLVLFYQSDNENSILTVNALIMYDTNGKVLYSSDQLAIVPKDIFQFFKKHIPEPDNSTTADLNKLPSLDLLIKLCGHPAADIGSGTSIYVYPADFGELVYFTVASGRVIHAGILTH